MVVWIIWVDHVHVLLVNVLNDAHIVIDHVIPIVVAILVIVAFAIGAHVLGRLLIGINSLCNVITKDTKGTVLSS